MDLTMAIGGICQAEDDENMSMELTTVLGGVLAANSTRAPGRQNRRRTIADEDAGEATMDMTIAAGGILSNDKAELQDGDDTPMDITLAIGGIVNPASPSRSRSAAKKAMEQEADRPDAAPATTLVEKRSPARRRPTPTEPVNTASPDLSAFRGQGLRRSPVSKVTAASSQTQASTPSKRTPVRASPARPVGRPAGRKSSSPNRQTSPDVKPATTRSPFSATTEGSGRIFRQDPSTGTTTPRVVLTPQKRRLSGIGADRPGLGSPRVAAILDR